MGRKNSVGFRRKDVRFRGKGVEFRGKSAGFRGKSAWFNRALKGCRVQPCSQRMWGLTVQLKGA